MNIVNVRRISSDKLIYFYTGSMVRATILFVSKIFPHLEQQMSDLVENVLSHPDEFNLKEELKKIPKEIRGPIKDFFTISTPAFTLQELRDGINQDNSNIKTYIADFIKIMRKDEDVEKLNLISQVKSCFASKKLNHETMAVLMYKSGSINNPFMDEYLNEYFAPFIKAGRDFLDLLLRLFFNKF